MATERRKLAWSIRRRLFALSNIQLFELAMNIATDNVDPVQFKQTDEESCMDYVTSYIQSDTLLQLEDEGLSQLLILSDEIDQIIKKSSSTESSVSEVAEINTLATPIPHSSNMISDSPPSSDNALENIETQSIAELKRVYEELIEQMKQREATVPQPAATISQPSQPQVSSRTHFTQERPATITDLSYLPRREFKLFGGQIGDNSSDISYNSLTKQINEGLKEGFTEAEVVRGVLRIVKPGTFRDMLMLKDELSIFELQCFLRSHLGEKAVTEMFQELMCARQTEQESPQQFLYRMIGLKQKLIFQSKQANTDISYDPKTIQKVFLHTVYQGLGVKYADLRQRLRPLTLNNNVADEEILREVTRIISDENEHQRRLGQVTRQKHLQAQSAVLETKETIPAKGQNAAQTIQHLAAQVQTLTDMVASLMELKTANQHQFFPPPATQNPPYPNSSPFPQQQYSHTSQPPTNQHIAPSKKMFLCQKCTELNLQDCSHCFVCGESGHRAVGCLKRTRTQGNGNRSLSRDSQRPAQTLCPSL